MGAFQNAWKFRSFRWAGEMGAQLGIPACRRGGVGWCDEVVGASVCAGREGGREGERLGALGGPGARQEVSALARGLTSGQALT